MEHRVTIYVQMLHFTKRQQRLDHFDVTLFDGQLKWWHERCVIGNVDTLQHFGIANIIDEIEIGNQVCHRPGRIVREGVTNLLQAVHIVKLQSTKRWIKIDYCLSMLDDSPP